MPDKMHDSGKRESFTGGAVRDASEGKPSFRLISPFILSGLANVRVMKASSTTERAVWRVVQSCARFRISKEPAELVFAFDEYVSYLGLDPAMERLSKWTELGAKKYSDRNWEKGMPLWRTLDSLMRHCFKCLKNRNDEDHDAAILWNLMAAVHYIGCVEAGSLTPDILEDLPDYREPLSSHFETNCWGYLGCDPGHPRPKKLWPQEQLEQEFDGHLPDGTLAEEPNG